MKVHDLVRYGRKLRATRKLWDPQPPALLCALLIAFVAGGCGAPQQGPMAQVEPPEAWRDELLSARAAKDDSFKSDPNSPLLDEDRANFDGLDYWAPDPVFYFLGPINYHAEPERFTIVTTTGQPRPCEKSGWVEFSVGGRMLRLQVYRLLDSPAQPGSAGFFLPFMDATSGAETYPAGRYVDLQGPPGGPFVLDFNASYNPFCAYGAPERYVCPRTPEENRLPVAIEAGERGFKHEVQVAAR